MIVHNMKYFLLILGIILWASQASAATYYIDPTCSSSGDGTTTTCGTHGPFTTWAQVPWAPGNTYSQKGGTTAYEQITIGASSITLNSYGTGNAIINGGSAIPAGSWTGPDENGVYSQPMFHSTILEDGIYLYNSYYTTPTNPPAGHYSEYWSQATEYYHPSSGTPANHTVERVAAVGIELGLHNYVTIQGFSFTKVEFGIHSIPSSTGAASYITITQNDFSNIEFGVWLSYYNAVSSNNSLTYNTFDSCFCSIEFYQATGSTSGGHSNVTIANNTITHGGMVNPPSFAYDWDYVDMNGADKEGIGLQDIINSNVYDNSISGHVRGIEVYVSPSRTGNTNNYYNNYIITSRDPIVFQPDKTATSFYSNNVYYNILMNVEGVTLGGVDDLNPPGSGSDVDEGYGISLGNTPSPVPTYNHVYNNTIYAGRAEGICFVDQYYAITNNIVYGSSNAYTLGTSTNNVVDYNLYYLGNYNNWYLNGSSINWTEWQTAGFDTHGLNVNPQFTNGNGAIPASTPWVLSYPMPFNMIPSDFSLQPGSPAVWTGINVGLTTDYAGNPVHNPPSIGAYDLFIPPPPQPRLE